MGKKDMIYFIVLIAASVMFVGLFFWVSIWILSGSSYSGRYYICDPEYHRPVSAQGRVDEETMIQGGFGGY